MWLKELTQQLSARFRRAGFGGEASHGLRARLTHEAKHWLRTAGAFVATLLVFALAYAGSFAWRERVELPLDPPGAAAGPAAGSRAIAAAVNLLSLQSLDSERDAWFAPPARQARLAAFQEGAAEAVAGFVAILARGRAGLNKELVLAAGALEHDTNGAPAARYASARDALRRFNALMAHRGLAVDRRQSLMADLALAAESASESHEQSLRGIAKTLHPGGIARQGRDEFYRARGQAYAWRLLLGAFGEDVPAEERRRVGSSLGAAQAALAAPAGFEPLLLSAPLTAGRDPLTTLAARLRAAAPALRRLADAAEEPPR